MIQSSNPRPDSPHPKLKMLPKPVYRQQYGLIVICAGERDQAALYKRLVSIGLKPRVVTT